MTKNTYILRWNTVHAQQLQKLGIHPMGGGGARKDWQDAGRKALTVFLCEIYAEHLRPRYELLGLDLPQSRDVLAARAVEVHHWHPSQIGDMTTEDLFLSLIEDFSHVPIPQDAMNALEYGLSDFPERLALIARMKEQGHPQ